MAVRQLAAKPMCAVCGRPVESFTEDLDAIVDKVTFEARCHGQVERIRIDGSMTVRDLGMAFATSPRRLAPIAAVALLAAAVSGCGDRPLEHGCTPGLDGGAAFCEATRGPAASCDECPR